MAKVSVIAQLAIKEGTKDRFVELIGAMLDAVEEEAGTEIYILNWDTKDENVAYIYELYTDGEALAAHSGSTAMAALMAGLGDVLSGAPKLTVATPTAGKGL